MIGRRGGVTLLLFCASTALAGLGAAPATAQKIAPDAAAPAVEAMASGCIAPGARPAPAAPEPAAAEPVIPRAKRAWEASFGGEQAARPHVRARLRGWPVRTVVDASTLPSDDHDFLRRLAADTWRGIDALSDRYTGLPFDTVRFPEAAPGEDAGAAPDAAASHVGDYAGTSDVGLYLAAVVAAYDLHLIDRATALSRVGRVLLTLGRLETHEGFFFNFYDTTSLERTSNFVSFVDSSWLTAALLLVRRAFPELADNASAIVEAEDYRFFYDRDERLMSHGFYVNAGKRSRFHYGLLYSEARLGSLIAIGKGDVPAEHWWTMRRLLLPACADDAPKVVGLHRVQHGTVAVTEGWYLWRGLRYLPSWGGSMFEALMPTLLIDEALHAPAGLGANDAVHVEAQQRFAAEVAGYPVWGLSPAATPHEIGYREYGARPLGVAGYGTGAVTPHAAALALAFDPDAATADLRRMASQYRMYGDFGLYDSVDPADGTVARAYLALDQSMLLVALANHLEDHAVQRQFASDPAVARALPLLAEERLIP